MKGYADLATLSENDRIDVMGRYIEEHPGELVGCVLDDAEKADRYVAKMLKRYKVKVVDRARLVNKVMLVRFMADVPVN